MRAAYREMMPVSIKYRAVVSDLHLGEGRTLENFVHGREFRSFVDHVASQGRQRDGVSELILNGDVVDFLQIAPLERAHWREAVGKLAKVFGAHRETIEALAKFVAAGNRIVVLVGNHDIELMFRDVQQAFIDGFDLPPGARERIVFPNEAPLDPVRFRGWTKGPFVYRVDGVHIEHGNQLDSLNYFDQSAFYEDEAKGLLRLPWGSRFVLSVFNEPAAKYRFLDKVRSKAAAALILWALDPKLAHDLLPNFKALGPDWVSKLLRYHLSSSVPAGGGARGVAGELELAVFGAVAQELQLTLHHPEVTAREGARDLPALRAKLALLKHALAKSPAAVDLGAADDQTDQAFAIATKTGAHTIVFGHTHGARNIERGGKRYLNTGTWIELVELDRLRAASERANEEPWPLIEAMLDPATYRSAPKLTYVELADGRVELRVWNEQG